MAQPSRKHTEEVLRVIQMVLTPYLGKLMASTAAAAHCRDLGIGGALLEARLVEGLLEKLRLGLVIFLGKEQTGQVMAALEEEIAELREAAP